jgi:hypothetical protein
MADYEHIVGSNLPAGAQPHAGLASIARGQAAHEQTAREKSRLEAIAIIYDAASPPDHDIRVRRFCAAQ